MTRLSDYQIRSLCLAPTPLVTPYDHTLVNPASIDVRLGDTILIESCEYDFVQYNMAELGNDESNPYYLRPGQFILAQTLETFNFPDNIAGQFVLKSSRAREGLNNLLAGYCDPGWHGSVLTLELQNVRQLRSVPIWPGMKIGQIVFDFMDQPPERSYAITGRYNNDQHVQESRG
jgi:dCTP deaminase